MHNNELITSGISFVLGEVCATNIFIICGSCFYWSVVKNTQMLGDWVAETEIRHHVRLKLVIPKRVALPELSAYHWQQYPWKHSFSKPSCCPTWETCHPQPLDKKMLEGKRNVTFLQKKIDLRQAFFIYLEFIFWWFLYMFIVSVSAWSVKEQSCCLCLTIAQWFEWVTTQTARPFRVQGQEKY